MRSVGFQPAEPLKIWVVSDGRAGIENQALGLGEVRRTRGTGVAGQQRGGQRPGGAGSVHGGLSDG